MRILAARSRRIAAGFVLLVNLSARPALAVCGDSVLDPGEQCEVGPNGDAACQEACVPPSLPDGCQCAAPDADPRDYVALAGLRMRLANEVGVPRGSVGVSSTGGYLAVGQFGDLSVTGQVVGDRVKIRESTSAGRLFANTATLLAGATLANGGAFRFAVPLVLAPPLPSLAVGNPGNTPVTVASGNSVVLPPGAYGDILVDRDATLTLQGVSPGHGSGRYDVRSLTVGFRAHLLADGPVDLRVADHFRVLPFAEVGPSPTATALAGDVRIAVDSIVAKAAHNATIRARLQAQRKIGIGGHADVTGQLIAPSVRASTDVRLMLEGGCGDGRLDAGEPCDASAPGGDAACPGACVAFDLAGQCTCP